jgi:L-threonylcarbamoyladenylate synthase
MVNSWRVQQAAQAVRAGAVIAYPTEAVWGLGCDPWDEEAVERLLLIKGRSVDKGLILVADNIRQFDFLFEDFPELWMDRMASTWPGPNTWLVPHQNLLPEWITGVHETVALRVSDHPLVRDLCSLVGPLVSTSANPQGRPAARTRLRDSRPGDRQRYSPRLRPRDRSARESPLPQEFTFPCGSEPARYGVLRAVERSTPSYAAPTTRPALSPLQPMDISG